MDKRMSWTYSNDATVNASVHDGQLAVGFCDAEVFQWSEPAGALTDWDDESMAEMIADAIRDNADDLAESIVKSLRGELSDD